MKLTVLTENVAGGRFQAEHGLSFLIEVAGEKFLFDAGYSDLFLRNATLLGHNIHNEVGTVILSHGHWDHGNGLRYLNGQRLVTHPDAFIKRYRASDNTYLGLALSREEILEKFDLSVSKKPVQLSEGMFFLGEVPRLNGFEAASTTFVNASGEPDFVMDDSAIVVVQDNELIIVTGCSHAGICNIVTYAQQVTGVLKVKAVVGGFHLKHDGLPTQHTVTFFKENNVAYVYPSHCTELPALVAFYDAFEIVQLKTGMLINI